MQPQHGVLMRVHVSRSLAEVVMHAEAERIVQAVR